MKLFGEFLVEKGLISKEELAEALVEQVRLMPSYVELAWRARLLEADDLLRLLKLQAERRVGFLEAMKELGLWNEKVDEALREGLKGARTPIGQILVGRGSLDMNAVTHALDEYLGSIEEPVPSPSGAPIPAPGPMGGGTGLGSPGQEIIVEVLTPDLRQGLAALAETFLAGGEVEQGRLKEFFDGVHQVRGAFRLAGTSLSEEQCAALEDAFQAALDLKARPADILKSLGRAGQAWCLLLAEMSRGLASGETEGDFYAKAPIKELREKVDGLLAVLKFDLEMAALDGGSSG